MAGFFGLPTGGQKSATSGLSNVFNYGFGNSQATQATGQGNLGTADAYFKSLLGGGRTQAMANAAPVVNAAQAQTDAQRQQESEMGTGRSGGTAGANREAATTTQQGIDNIINQNLVGGRSEAAKGETSLGQTELGNSINMLGLGTRAQQDVLGSAEQQAKQQAGFGGAIGKLIGMAAFGV